MEMEETMSEYWSDKLPHTKVVEIERYRFHYAQNGGHNVDVSKAFTATSDDFKYHWELMDEFKEKMKCEGWG